MTTSSSSLFPSSSFLGQRVLWALARIINYVLDNNFWDGPKVTKDLAPISWPTSKFAWGLGAPSRWSKFRDIWDVPSCAYTLRVSVSPTLRRCYTGKTCRYRLRTSRRYIKETVKPQVVCTNFWITRSFHGSQWIGCGGYGSDLRVSAAAAAAG